MKKIAVIGTQGVPANYGGFESLVENIIGENCPDDIEYTVFCSSKDMPSRIAEYKGAKLKYVGLHANGAQSIPYDMISMLRARKGFDSILILGVSGCLFLPIFKHLTRSKIIVNIDGLEHRRAKWGKIARRVLRASEAAAVHHAHTIISDNSGIRNYVTETYGVDSKLIAYGGDHVKRNVSDSFVAETLASIGVKPKEYAIGVCRIEPENNCRMVLEAFSKTDYPLVYIGNWGNSDYATALKSEFSGFANIHIVDAIYDLDKLYALRSNAGIYVHGHSAGGTNPSLVEAMFFGCPILAFDVVYNRATTQDRAYYFSDALQLRDYLTRKDLTGEPLRAIAERDYVWRSVARQYTSLF